jgi:hypothetical protein
MKKRRRNNGMFDTNDLMKTAIGGIVVIETVKMLK